MIQKVLFPVLFIISIQALGQSIVEGTSYSHFQIKSKKDTIDFVIADTNLNVNKPLLLFCQGSQPIPLFIDFGEQDIWPVSLNNFDVEEIKKHYHIVVISMPKTPLMAKVHELNKSYAYVADTSKQHSFSTEYMKADYLDNYVNRANAVWNFLKDKKWVDNSKFVVAGHSQGSHIALEIAATNKNVTQLGLFGFNPLGRIDQSIRTLRKQAERGEISWKEADSIQQIVLNDYASYFNPEHPEYKVNARSWVSFSKSQVNIVAKLKLPVYIAYGSDDITSDFCDLLPLYFIEQQKTNYKVIRYPNLDHNFFPVDEKGKADHDNGKWELVMNEFTKWTEDTVNNK